MTHGDQSGSRPLLSTSQAAVLLGISARTLEAWRLTGGGPPFRKLGTRCVRYHPDELEAFSARGARFNTGQTG